METNALKVKLWGMTAGYLAWDKKNGVASFEYDCIRCRNQHDAVGIAVVWGYFAFSYPSFR